MIRPHCQAIPSAAQFAILLRPNICHVGHMSPMVVPAHAKTNLSLRVLGRREDGFHEIHTRMTQLSLADTLEITRHAPGKGFKLEVAGADWKPRHGEENLVAGAARVFTTATRVAADVTIKLTKRIPSGAGLGGGSSDAAATLMALDRMFQTHLGQAKLIELAASLGSDVPFFIHGRLCECTGRGECVVPIDDDWELPVVLFKPAFGVPTPDAYKRWASAPTIPGVLYAPQICPWGEMVNDLERPVFAKYPVLGMMKMWLLRQPGVYAALMCGSGSTLMAVLSAQHGGEHLAQRAKEEFGPSLWIHVGQTLCESSAAT